MILSSRAILERLKWARIIFYKIKLKHLKSSGTLLEAESTFHPFSEHFQPFNV